MEPTAQQPTQQESTQPKKGLNRKVILIALCILAVVIAVVASASWFFFRQNKVTTTLPDVPRKDATATIEFSPTTLTVQPGSSGTADIMVDTGSNSTSGINLYVVYEAEAFTRFDIFGSKDFFGEEVDMRSTVGNLPVGKYIYLYISNPSNIPEKMGKGKIGTIRYTLNPSYRKPKTQVQIDTTATLVLSRNNIQYTTQYDPLDILITRTTPQPTQ